MGTCWCSRWLHSRPGLSVTEASAARVVEDMTSNMLLLSLRALQAWASKPTSKDDLIQVSARISLAPHHEIRMRFGCTTKALAKRIPGYCRLSKRLNVPVAALCNTQELTCLSQQLEVAPEQLHLEDGFWRLIEALQGYTPSLVRALWQRLFCCVHMVAEPAGAAAAACMQAVQ